MGRKRLARLEGTTSSSGVGTAVAVAAAAAAVVVVVVEGCFDRCYVD